MSESKFTLEELLQSAGRQLREDFREIQKCNPHAGERGGEAEDILKKFLAERLPKRFGVSSGIVVGKKGDISRQSDILIYDAINSPVYRSGTRLQILPRDNVAAVIEVKSKINKAELADAAEKIASVKSIKASPISGIDQPVNFGELVMTGTMGCVFAFDTYSSLKTLAENLKDINSERDSNSWIDLVVVLDQGCIGYAMQSMYSNVMSGWMGGALVEDFLIPPCYIHLVQTELQERTLNHFFLKLMSHITLFRKIPGVDFDSLLKTVNAQTIAGYQYNLSRQLVPVEKRHQINSFENPKLRFNIYLKQNRTIAGQVCLIPWQNGAVITCSSSIPHTIILNQYFKRLKLKSSIHCSRIENATIAMSYVLPISENDFVKISESLHPDLITKRDDSTDMPPPAHI